MRVLYDRVAAIDVHKDMVKVAIRVPGASASWRTHIRAQNRRKLRSLAVTRGQPERRPICAGAG